MIKVIKTMLCAAILTVTCFWSGIAYSEQNKTEAHEENQTEAHIESFLKRLYDIRATALIHQNERAFDDYYLTDKQSSNALKNEIRRMDYINAWANKRSLKLVDAKSEIKIVRIKVKDDRATVSLVQSLKVSYDYPNKEIPTHSFGIGTRHFLTLKLVNGKWMVSREWYLDPLDENPKKIAEGALPSVKITGNVTDGKKFKREQAVAYANKYAGIAWGAGNNRRYNPNYKDYTYHGGDCTNFSSQVLGDKEGGGLPMTKQWNYSKGYGGTQQWVRTDSLGKFLIYSGYGKMIAKGDFQHIVTPTKEHPNGAIARLQPGDLIGYIIQGNDIDHFSILVGFDPNGYPLVNSHTADRYQVPFDLGWDRYTKYVLIHIKD